MEYIKLKDIAKKLPLKRGDIVYVSSDTIRMLSTVLHNEKKFDLNDFINGLIDVIGLEGTLLFPTFNWDFCKNKVFNYHKTIGMTGSLGNIALKRKDFKRTKHPIYSFAVFGKDKDYLCSLDNISAFGRNSPFNYLYEKKAKNLIIDVELKNCLTFAHYVEEMNKEYVKYRYLKNFTSNYIDEKGYISEKTYSMFVRKLELNVVNSDSTEFEKLFKKNSCINYIRINESIYKVLDMEKEYNIIANDIIFNNAKLTVAFDGQK